MSQHKIHPLALQPDVVTRISVSSANECEVFGNYVDNVPGQNLIRKSSLFLTFLYGLNFESHCMQNETLCISQKKIFKICNLFEYWRCFGDYLKHNQEKAILINSSCIQLSHSSSIKLQTSFTPSKVSMTIYRVVIISFTDYSNLLPKTNMIRHMLISIFCKDVEETSMKILIQVLMSINFDVNNFGSSKNAKVVFHFSPRIA